MSSRLSKVVKFRRIGKGEHVHTMGRCLSCCCLDDSLRCFAQLLNLEFWRKGEKDEEKRRGKKDEHRQSGAQGSLNRDNTFG